MEKKQLLRKCKTRKECGVDCVWQRSKDYRVPFVSTEERMFFQKLKMWWTGHAQALQQSSIAEELNSTLAKRIHEMR